MSTLASDNRYLYRVTLDLRIHELNPTGSKIKDIGGSVSHIYRKNYIWAPKRQVKQIFSLQHMTSVFSVGTTDILAQIILGYKELSCAIHDV